MRIGRVRDGIPADWGTVDFWLKKNEVLKETADGNKPAYSVDNKEIVILQDYRTPPEKSFWSVFPSRAIPKKPSTRVNPKNLEKVISEAGSKLTCSEIKRGKRIVNDLKQGADACQKSVLPAMTAQNNSTSYDNGPMVTDKIATWIKKEIVAGPFETPPMAGFRANPLIAIERNNKVRLVVNMSGPKGASFNDNLDRKKLREFT